MVTVTSYIERKSQDGRSFYSIVFQGGVEPVLSEKTGRYYLTSRQSSVTTTLDEETCKSLVGTKMPERITKVKCDPYDHVIRETGEIVKLSHSWVYSPNEAAIDEMVIDEKKVVEAEAFKF